MSININPILVVVRAAELVMLDKPDEMLELHGLGTLAALELVLPEDHAVLGGLALKKENYSTEAETFVLGFI